MNPCSRCHGSGQHTRRNPDDLKATITTRCGRCGGTGTEPRQAPVMGPFLTIPQQAWAGEQAWRKRHGKPPLEPRTAAQREVDAGRIPGFVGGKLDD